MLCLWIITGVFKREVNNAISENQVQFKAVVVEKVKTYCNEYGKGEAFIDLKVN